MCTVIKRFWSIVFLGAGIGANAEASADVALDVVLARDAWAVVDGLRSDTGTWSVVEVRTDSMSGAAEGQFKDGFSPPLELSARLKGRMILVAAGEMRTLWRGSHVETEAIRWLFQVPFPGPKSYFDESMKPLKWRYSRVQPDSILFIALGVAQPAFLEGTVKTAMHNEYKTIVELPRVYGVPEPWRKAAIEFAEWVKVHGMDPLAWNSGEAERLNGNPLMRLAKWRDVLEKRGDVATSTYPADIGGLERPLQAAMIYGLLRALDDPVAKERHAEAVAALASKDGIDRYAWGVATVAHMIFVEGRGGVNTDLQTVLRAAEERAVGEDKQRWKELIEVADAFAGGRAELMSGRAHERQ